MTITTSPFSHLFCSNYAASHNDVPLIKDLLSTSLETLCRLNSEIQQLQTTLQKLEQERDSVQHYVDAHKALLSPVRALPVEIISEIFAHCLPGDRNPICSHAEAPLLLGRVCKDWRDVSLSSPCLWASIHIVIPMSGNPSVLHPLIDARTQGIESWLTRSGSLPLSISIFAVPSEIRGEVTGGLILDSVGNLLDCISQRSNRWQDIHFNLSRACISMVKERWPWGGNRELPHLRTFKLTRPTRPLRSPSAKFEREWVSKAPNLRILSLRLVEIGDLLVERFPWSRLTHLELQMPTIVLSAAVHVLSQCRDLQSLTMSSVDPADAPTEVHTITFPYLRSLSIRSRVCFADKTTAVDVCNIFCYIDAPVLRSLKVHIWGSEPDSCIPFVGLLSPGNLIEELDICGPSDILIDTLALLPNVTVLRIRNSTLYDILLHRLTPSHSIHDEEHLQPLCRSLKQLYLIGSSVKNNDQMFLDLVYSRRNFILVPDATDSMPLDPVTARLDVFHVLLNRYKQSIDLQDQLQKLRDQGMDVIFAHREEINGNLNPGRGQDADDCFSQPTISHSGYCGRIGNEERRHSWWSW
ncbi:hypothetical protein D9758_008205 [Tetrapyrgos nigripes]|uniref:F-box domain-containing protein n=1 Tax=Tetrapyrgos nigripes TaxID=182062 RepID=A0A8H5LGS7_9AGAR|nr:hypothetical protein D9758_008205 [Tetrapyrgos nigripes]